MIGRLQSFSRVAGGNAAASVTAELIEPANKTETDKGKVKVICQSI